MERWSITVNWLPWEFVVISEECMSNVFAGSFDPAMYSDHMEDVVTHMNVMRKCRVFSL